MREMMPRCDTMRKEYEEKLEQFYRSYPIMRYHLFSLSAFFFLQLCYQCYW
jgi:hypothetical protein